MGPSATITSPASGANYQPPATIPITATASDSGGQAIARVDFYASGTLIGTDNTGPYQLSWSNVGLGTYVLTARAVNAQGIEGISAPVHVSVSNLNTVTAVPATPVVGQPTTIHVTGVNPCSALMFNFGDGPSVTQAIDQLPAESDPPHAWATSGTKVVTVTGQGGCLGTISTTVTVGQNQAPSVSLTSPASGTVVLSGATIPMVASASDTHGIASVKFYADGILRHTDYDAPYSFDWVGVPYGSHTLQARAVDHFGVTGASPTVTVSAQDIQSVSSWPSLAVAGRKTGVAVHGSPTCASVQVNYGDGQSITYGQPLPFSDWHTYANPGTYTITATGQGSCAGLVSTSITVLAPPVVAFTWPPEGQTYAAPAEVSMTASASDPDGTINGVAYYVNGEPLAWTTSTPYYALQSNVGTGRYLLSAVVVDNQGIRTVSDPRTITVGSPAASTVSGVSVLPLPLAVNEGAKVTVSGTNPCSAVQVNFGNGHVQTFAIFQLPYTIDYEWPTAGTYTVTATGIGGCGGTVSRTITVTGASPAPEPEPSAEPGDEPVVDASTFDLEEDIEEWIESPSVLEAEEGASSAEAAPAPVPQSTVLLIVNLMGTGTGTVVTSPAGINCAGGFGLRCVMNVTPGTVVTLAQAPDAGSTFSGWGGACSGTGACQITVGQHTLVVATFRVPPPLVVQYYHLDAIGSVRAVTGDNGALMRQVDYAPFGDSQTGAEQQPVPPIGKQQRFTSKERDVETSLDYFGARYSMSPTGRFTTVDPVVDTEAALTDPQRWNRYAYALNNPLAVVDPDGRDPRWAIWTRIVQSAPIQRVLNHPITQRVVESAPLGRVGELLGRFNDKLFDLSLRLTTTPPAQAAFNVWQTIEATGPRYANTLLPTQFNLRAGNSIVEVVPSATKHIFEAVLGLYRAGVTPQTLDFAVQFRLASLQQAVAQALAAGVRHREAMSIGGWELVFALENGKQILIHALPITDAVDRWNDHGRRHGIASGGHWPPLGLLSL